MSIKLEWDNPERTAIRLTYKGRWTAQEFREQALAAFFEIGQQSHKIYGLMDFRRTMWLPPNILPIVQEILPQTPSNAAELVTVGLPAPLLLALRQLRLWYANTPVYATQSLEEARHLIRSLGAQNQKNTLAEDLLILSSASKLIQELQESRIISLTSFERMGKAIETPMPFIYIEREDQATIYCLTAANNAHIQRIRHNPYVWVAAYPKTHEQYLRASASIESLSSHEKQIAEMQWLMKHGVLGWSSRMVSSIVNGSQVWLRIVLNGIS